MGRRPPTVFTMAAAATPRLPLLALGLLLAGTLAFVALARWSGAATLSAAPASAADERLLRFEDRDDGGITIADARSGRAIDSVAPGTNGFLRSAVRGLVRERRRQGLGAETPFRLLLRTDGRLLLEDPATGRQIDLRSFGPTNAGVFARLLTRPST